MTDLKTVVYCAQQGVAGPIKIGVTAQKIALRIHALQTGNPEKIRVLATISGSRALEQRLHVRFRHCRKMHGEWFDPCADLLSFVDGIIAASAQALGIPERFPTDEQVAFLAELQEELTQHGFEGPSFNPDVDGPRDDGTVWLNSDRSRGTLREATLACFEKFLSIAEERIPDGPPN